MNFNLEIGHPNHMSNCICKVTVANTAPVLLSSEHVQFQLNSLISVNKVKIFLLTC